MVEISRSIRVFIDSRDSRVLIRTRWCHNQHEVTFVAGVYAQIEKWDDDLHRAKKNTTHVIRGMKFTASQINERIAEFREAIECCFSEYMQNDSYPLEDQMKTYVNQALCRDEPNKAFGAKLIPQKSFKELFEDFLSEVGREKNWTQVNKTRYKVIYNSIVKAFPHLSMDSITIDTMYDLRDWYIKNNFKNRTITKWFVIFKTFLRWVNEQDGYSIPAKVLNFSPNLSVIRRTVTFLHYDELTKFAEFQFEKGETHLEHARDLWCFMAYTSLRYSDLVALKNVHIVENKIDMFAKKTNEHLTIPLTAQAQRIIDKYKGKYPNSPYVFDTMTNQKLNEYIKLAAEKAGINREVLKTYFVGTERKEEVHKFYEIISCHDARRTFVSCSLAMGIPPEVVMKCTGHHSYSTMKPYIETSVETQTLEMEKWDKNKYRSQINSILDKASENDLIAIHDWVVNYAQGNQQ